MRPETAYRRVNAAIQRALRLQSFSALNVAVPAMQKLLTKCQQHGDDVPAYYTPETDIGTLSYIQDRFCCSGRLRWMLQKAAQASST